MRLLLVPFMVNIALMLKVHDFDSRVDLPISEARLLLSSLPHSLLGMGWGVMDCGNRAGFLLLMLFVLRLLDQ